MILAIDVMYYNDNAQVGGVLFKKWSDDEPFKTIVLYTKSQDEYIPGAFYKKELKPILDMLNSITDNVDTVVVDGYVDLGPGRPGLGRYLYDTLNEKITVVGVAKSKFISADDIPVLRGKSKRPLHITSAGIREKTASKFV